MSKLKLKIIALSDSHLMNLPKLLDGVTGDFLIHCGDLTNIGSFEEIYQVKRQLIQVKGQFPMGTIITPGNHDTILEKMPLVPKEIAKELGIHILIDEMVEINGIKFWGSPYTPRTSTHSVFQYPKGIGTSRWGAIPYGLDVLITHGPPAQILDVNTEGERLGCWDLRHEVMKKQPKIHTFGHIHRSNGNVTMNGVKFYNCAIYNKGTNTFHGITEIDYEKEIESPGGAL